MTGGVALGRSHDPSGKRITNRLFTVSNLLSIARAVLMVPFVALMYSSMPDARLWACGVIVVAILTDKLDGVLARKLHQVTEWGRILDPLTDKLAIGTVAIVLLLKELLPLWFLLVILIRDIAIFAGGMYVKTKKGVVLPSIEAGKWAVGVLTLTLFLILLGYSSVLVQALMVASLILMAWSTVLYVQRFMNLFKN